MALVSQVETDAIVVANNETGPQTYPSEKAKTFDTAGNVVGT